MNKELLEALEQVEKEKNISKETLLEAIENSLLTACKNHFGRTGCLLCRGEGIIPEIQRPFQKAGKGMLVPDGWKLCLIKLENSSIRKPDARDQEIGGKRFGENEEADFLLGGKTVFVYAIDVVRYGEIKTDHADGRLQRPADDQAADFFSGILGNGKYGEDAAAQSFLVMKKEPVSHFRNGVLCKCGKAEGGGQEPRQDGKDVRGADGSGIVKKEYGHAVL